MGGHTCHCAWEADTGLGKSTGVGWNMPRWKEIPDSVDDRVRQLVVQLRRLKDRSGLSLSSLESKTGYSRSSWRRYLNGQALPPRPAVEGLARVAGVEPTRLLVLHEVAEDAWRREPGAAETAPETAGTPAPRKRRRGVLIGVCAAVVLGAVLLTLLLTAPWSDDTHGSGSAASAPRGAFAYRPGKTYPCKVQRKNGSLYAGYSTTRTALLAKPGWDVVEAQCLLLHHGFDPQGADGAIGEKTTRAVKRLQQSADLEPDGIVGPDTWRVLRK
jgi:transcriptional regulator with XRE-family HTH domain